jgi:serine phosphatase RsbU (regulator of sigma subunit)
LRGENIPLGFSEREIYKQVVVPIEAGDMFFFYSDGVTETKNETGEFFGEDRLIELIRAHGGLEPEALIDTIRSSVVAFARTETFADDVTCVAVKVADTQRLSSQGKGTGE